MGIFTKAIPHLLPHSKKGVSYLRLAKPPQREMKTVSSKMLKILELAIKIPSYIIWSDDGADENERIYMYSLGWGLIVSARGTLQPSEVPSSPFFMKIR